jgi:hypothetical protein
MDKHSFAMLINKQKASTPRKPGFMVAVALLARIVGYTKQPASSETAALCKQ